MQQLLWIETLLKLTSGLVLTLAPISAIKLLGLPRTETGFWPRLLGAVLIGLGGALFLQGRIPGSPGLGLGGCVVINLAGASIIASMLVVDAGPQPARGQAVLWLLVAALLLLSILEIARL